MPVVNSPCIAAIISISMLLVLGGCGTHIAGSAASTPSTSAWLFAGASSERILAAALTDTAGIMTGPATVYSCGKAAEQTTLRGTRDSSSKLNLQSGTLAEGLVLHITGQLSPDKKSLLNPTIIASQEGCRLPGAQKVTAEVYAPTQGSYTGVFTGSDGATTPVAAVLSQGASPGLGGSYSLGGSVAFPNSPCLATAAINSAESMVIGGMLSATYTATVSGQQVIITATGAADPNATHIAITGWTIRGGPCDGYSGTGSLDIKGQT